MFLPKLSCISGIYIEVYFPAPVSVKTCRPLSSLDNVSQHERAANLQIIGDPLANQR